MREDKGERECFGWSVKIVGLHKVVKEGLISRCYLSRKVMKVTK